MVTKVLTQLIAGTKWVDIDYLIIDLPPGTGDVHLSLVQQFKPDGVVLVSTPQNLAAIDVIKAIDMFATLQIPILGVVQNMAYLLNEAGERNYIFGNEAIAKMAEDFNIRILGNIAINQEVNQANENRHPICHQNPSHPIAFEFGKIAENIVDSK
jgi:ATP-binding protein involved in chromosome partitioning